MCQRALSRDGDDTDVLGSFVTADGLWGLPPFLAVSRGRVQMSPLPPPHWPQGAGVGVQFVCPWLSSWAPGSFQPVTFRNKKGPCLLPGESGRRGGPPGAVTGVRREGCPPQRAGWRRSIHTEKQLHLCLSVYSCLLLLERNLPVSNYSREG